ncbi:NAD-dependent epimerase/dehydratase family protein [Paenibacillus sp. L3-i20]|uniref:NAD-dependent epimerase/dehydratase family protein n=1 Tax=Paenibacillus sp. L3-i20 TaxID=2905833 RepID=UPI001EE14085|nr:NAD-dependent epimerase/dehydratase family protein [Paenibacillus sp. L3-i20]GKU76808.1 hypothetical protein L3i20_v212050 [Paenibacillus sp. L3-i20]
MFNNTKVFVTGGAGVIGTSLVNKLLEQGAIILVGDLKERPANLPAAVLYRQGDLNYITKEELVHFAPEFVFHLAATFERSVETAEFWEENNQHNVKLSHHIMSVLKDISSVKQVVFASSYLIYNPELYNFNAPAKAPYLLTEEAPVYPRNLCGAAKLLHEIELRFLSEMQKFKTVYARIYRVYGKDSKDIISRWIRALLNNEEIQVFRKEGMFDYIYAEDVAEGLLQLAGNGVEGIVNLGNGNARRVEEIIEILKGYFPNMKFVEADSSILYEASQADMAKFSNITGWHPERQLEDTIPELIQYYSYQNNKKAELKVESLLITSVSKKVPLVKSVRQAIMKLGTPIRIIGADSNSKAIARQFVDHFWLMPNLADLTVDTLIQYCIENNVKYIIPTRDGELKYFADHKLKLLENNIRVFVSEPEVIAMCLDKLAFYEKSKEWSTYAIPAFNHIPTSSEELHVVKERYGAGSVSIGLALDRTQALKHAKTLKEPIFQPYIEGVEYSADIFLNKDSISKGVILRVRDYIVNGESQITYTVRDESMERMIAAFAEQIGLTGHAVLQYIVDADGKCHIIECNPRVGGASKLSLEMGLDSIYWFLLESRGSSIHSYPFLRSSEEKKLVRYAEDLII